MDHRYQWAHYTPLIGNGSMVEFDLSNQAAGVYYVVVRAGKETITQKVIKL